jgi:hypothetical protein
MTLRYVVADTGETAGPFFPIGDCYERCPHRDTTVCGSCAAIAAPYLVDVLGQWCLCDTAAEAAVLRAELDAVTRAAAAEQPGETMTP